MKVVTAQQFEQDFEAIIDDVADNKQYYRIQTESGDFMLVPHDEYEVLKETYKEWVDEPAINPDPLPIEYIGEAEPEKLT
jgi:PHD/YefM family antitoxin component YafN of YafNO toxin-antitoxin module